MIDRHQSSTQQALKFSTHIVKSLRRQYVVYMLVAALLATVSLLPAQLFHFFSSQLGTLDEVSVSPFLRRLFLFGFVVAISGALAMLGKIMLKEWLLLHLEVFLRRKVITQLHALPLESIEGTQRGDWLTRASADVRTTEDFLGTTVPEFIYTLAMLVGTAALLLFSTGVVALLPILAAFVVAVVNVQIQKKLVPLMVEMRGLHAGLMQVLIENLEGWKTIRAYDATPTEKARVEHKLGLFYARGMSAARLIGWTMSSNDFVTQSLVVLCFGALAWSVAGHTLTVDQALLYPFYLSQFFFSVKGLVMSASGWSRYVANGGKLAEWLMLPAQPEAETRLAPVLDVKTLEIKSLAVKVPGSERVLIDDMSIGIQAGEIRGLVGPSGCGKSTLLEILAGLRKAKHGEFRLVKDETPILSGDISLLPNSLCAYVAQKPYIFEGTLEANLTLGGKSFSVDEIRVAVEMAGLNRVFDERGGLNALLYDRGENLSEGQRYRIAIARALLQKRPFLLLDEPFAALDGKATDGIVETLNRIKHAKGIFLVTHYVPKSLQFDKVYSLFGTDSMRNEKFYRFASPGRVVRSETDGGAKDGRAPLNPITSVN